MSTRKKSCAKPPFRARVSAQSEGNRVVEVIGGATICIPAPTSMVAADYWGGHLERIPFTIVYLFSWFRTFGYGARSLCRLPAFLNENYSAYRRSLQAPNYVMRGFSWCENFTLIAGRMPERNCAR